MKDNVLNAALREVVSREFADIPQHENEIAYKYSDGFTRRMNKLTKAEKSRFWRMTNTIPTRVAAVFVVIMLITLTACSIPTVRAAVVDFIKETYENCIHLFTGEAGSKKISKHYILAELPEGFVETKTDDSDASFVVVYQNEKGDKIILSQNITEGHWIDIDNEYGNISEIDISGIKVTLYEFDDCIVAVWIQDQYAFNLTVYGEYNIELIIRMIEAIRLP